MVTDSRDSPKEGSPSKSSSGSAYQPLDVEFVRDTFGFSNRGVISDRRNTSKGIQISTNVDLSQWSEEELIQLDLPDELIEKLAPYLGKRGLEAAQILKEAPLEISWYDTDLLGKAIMRYWAKYYGRIYDESIKSIKGRHLLTWVELDVQVRTIIYTVLQQIPSISSIPNFWNYATRQQWKHLGAEIKHLDKQDMLKRGGESTYFGEFLKQENYLSDTQGRGGGGNNKMVTLQLPKIDPGLSKSMENLATSSRQSSPSKNPKTLARSSKDASLDSSNDGQNGLFARAPIGSPVPRRISPVGKHAKDNSPDGRNSPTWNSHNQSDNLLKVCSNSSLRSDSRNREKKLDHLGHRLRSSSFNLANCNKPLLPPGYCDITVIDDVTVMHKSPSCSKVSSGGSFTHLSGSPSQSRRNSYNLDATTSFSNLGSIGRSRESIRRSSINLLPPLEDQRPIESRRKSKVRSLNASPIKKGNDTSSPFTHHNIAAAADKSSSLHVPSFHR